MFSQLIDLFKIWLRPKEETPVYSNPADNLSKPKWFNQVVADLKRHEGYRQYAYPDPLSKLGRKYPSSKYRWGFERADVILAQLGEKAEDGKPWTIGYGFTAHVTPASVTTIDQSTQRLQKEINSHLPILDKLIPTWRGMPVHVQTVLVNMAYNLGWRLKPFAPTLQAIKDGKYEYAAGRLRRSLWFKQTGTRAVELVERLEKGKIADEHRVI